MVCISYNHSHRYSLADNQIHSHRLYSVTLLPTYHTYYKIIHVIMHHHVCVPRASIGCVIVVFVGIKKNLNAKNHLL